MLRRGGTSERNSGPAISGTGERPEVVVPVHASARAVTDKPQVAGGAPDLAAFPPGAGLE
jgi:hypothetical protein